jgi:uncharacterized protein DUF6932
MIPPFAEDGFLPPGVHTATLAEFEERFQDARRTTFIRHIDVAGSFVTSKPDPNDFDCLLVFDQTPASADLRPFEYNLLSQSAAKRRFGGDVAAVLAGSPRHAENWNLFQMNRQQQKIGIVEVVP